MAHSAAGFATRMGDDDVVISVRDLGKCYQIYDRPQDRLKQALLRWRGKTYFREFWALRDVSFDVKHGETLGIIGRNGSGKSTLLQILAGTLCPTEGDVRVRGRIAALLELGSGFNPDFTGRENVFMNGSILGVPQREMERRFDEIAAFADIGEFIDQPVSTYSSGMYVRLAFSVATSVEPDILIVDEALAVGDMLFQHRCIDRIRKLVAGGTTLIFVSHDPDTVRALCQRGLWLEHGRPQMLDAARTVSEQYVSSLFLDHNVQVVKQQKERDLDALVDEDTAALEATAQNLDGGGLIEVEGIRLLDADDRPTDAVHHGEQFSIEVAIRSRCNLNHVSVGFVIKDRLGIELTGESVFNQKRRGFAMQAGEAATVRFVTTNNLRGGDYSIALRVNRVSKWDRSDNLLLYSDDTAMAFRVVGDDDQPMWFRFRHPFEVHVS